MDNRTFIDIIENSRGKSQTTYVSSETIETMESEGVNIERRTNGAIAISDLLTFEGGRRSSSHVITLYPDGNGGYYVALIDNRIPIDLA